MAKNNDSLFPAPGSQQRLSLNSKSLKTNKKVALKPGRSLMDWIRLGHSGQDLTSVGGQTLNVTMDELMKHNTEEDAWIAIRGRVYNITPYMEYHPGGIEELMRGAGIDGTQLFDEIHKWVNAESMLEKCYIGKLSTDFSLHRKVKHAQVQKLALSESGSGSSPLELKLLPSSAPRPQPQPPMYNWFQNSKAVTIAVYTKWKKIQHEHVVIDKTGLVLLISLVIDLYTYKIHLELEEDVTPDYNIKVYSESGKVEITMPKCNPEKQWKILGKPLQSDKMFVKTSETETVFREGTVVSILDITHNIKLFCVEPPEGSRFCVPIGHHIHVRHRVTDMEIIRSYTCVLPSLHPEQQDIRVDQGKAFYLMIKIYPDGTLTPWIGSLREGDTLSYSESDGNFDMSLLAGVTHLILFAAGTGFTPMVRLIYHTVVNSSPESKMQVKLIFYNKTEQDIPWREQLDDLASKESQFQFTNILSEADENWTGLQGRVCNEHVASVLPPTEDGIKPFVCACGPRPFTEKVIESAISNGLAEAHLYAFLA